MADAATSVLAIAALVVAMYANWVWADPAVGIIGSLVIANWAVGLIRASGAVLLDVNADRNLETVIRDRLETKGDRVTDLHLWQVGPGHRAAVIGSPAAARHLQAPARRLARPTSRSRWRPARIPPIPPHSGPDRAEGGNHTRLTIRDGWFHAVKSTTPRSD
jgi:Co/Zn/Cd efflux system component